MKKIAVFCGASSGNQPEYTDIARQFAHALHDQNLGLVYGGGKLGLMGAIADELLALKGEVIGVMPDFLVQKEIAHPTLSKLCITQTMQERKTLISELSDGFVMLPGGVGSLEEFFEIFSAGQLGLHQKPCCILNIKNYYNQLIDFLKHATQEGFLKTEHQQMMLIDEEPAALIHKIMAYHPPKARWS
ncbi:MAG: TIGR00730 family Rossman fold protein [Gammaproteobacteria bacterium]|nr:TIGR00730 family Rossman fold protein [Gammaproteobacteria bacterium]